MSTSSEQPRSRTAMLSLIFGLVLWFLWCAPYAVFGILAETNNLSESAGLAAFLIAPVILGVITLGLGIAGVVFGIQAIRKQDPRRGLAIAGLVLNFLCLCPVLALTLLVLVSGASSIPSLIRQALP